MFVGRGFQLGNVLLLGVALWCITSCSYVVNVIRVSCRLVLQVQLGGGL